MSGESSLVVKDVLTHQSQLSKAEHSVPGSYLSLCCGIELDGCLVCIYIYVLCESL